MDQYLSMFLCAAGFTIGLILFIIPKVAIWILLVSIMLITGCVSYIMPAFNGITWANVIIAAIFSVRIIVFAEKEKYLQKQIIPFPLIFILIFAFYCLIAIFSNTFFKESITASKNIFQFLSLPFVLFFGRWTQKNVSAYMIFILTVALITPVIILIQAKIFGAGYDLITGTFGSSYLAGGGPNAAMSTFLVSQIGVLIFLAKYNYIPWALTIVLSVFLLYGLTFTMAQAIIGFLLIVFVFVLLDYKINQFKKMIIFIFSFFVLFGFILNSYFMTTQDIKKNSLYMSPPKGYTEYLKNVVESNLSPEYQNLNRTGLVLLWYRFNIENNDMLGLIFGHGLGATKSAGLEIGHIQKLFGNINIGRTALSALLWEVGILGTGIYLCIYVSAFCIAKKLNKIDLPGIHKVFIKSAQLSCLLFILSIPYKFSIIENQPFNFYSFFIIGYICYWHRQIYGNKCYREEYKIEGHPTKAHYDSCSA